MTLLIVSARNAYHKLLTCHWVHNIAQQLMERHISSQYILGSLLLGCWQEGSQGWGDLIHTETGKYDHLETEFLAE